MRWLWGTRRRLSSEGASLGAADLAGEAEAFLSGRYAEYVAARGGEVPSWALLNSFAHGGPEVLGPPPGTRATVTQHARQGWAAAARSLRDDLVELVGDDPGLLEGLQQAVLVPLELAMASEQMAQLSPHSVLVYAREALRSARL